MSTEAPNAANPAEIPPAVVFSVVESDAFTLTAPLELTVPPSISAVVPAVATGEVTVLDADEVVVRGFKPVFALFTPVEASLFFTAREFCNPDAAD